MLEVKYKLLIIIACLLSLTILLPACNRSSEKEDAVITTEPALETEVTSLEQEEIITFTQQVLEIEAKRSELIDYFASYQTIISQMEWLVGMFFLDGVPQGFDASKNLPKTDIEGMTSLRKSLLFLDCPHSLQSVKDIFIHIYSSEIELVERQLKGEEYLSEPPYGPPVPYFIKSMLVLPPVNQYNVELWLEEYDSDSAFLMKHPWVELQLLRIEVYTRWAEILREYGIVPAQERFTELVGR